MALSSLSPFGLLVILYQDPTNRNFLLKGITMEALFALYLIVKSIGVYAELQVLKEFTDPPTTHLCSSQVIDANDSVSYQIVDCSTVFKR